MTTRNTISKLVGIVFVGGFFCCLVAIHLTNYESTELPNRVEIFGVVRGEDEQLTLPPREEYVGYIMQVEAAPNGPARWLGVPADGTASRLWGSPNEAARQLRSAWTMDEFGSDLPSEKRRKPS